MIDKSTVISSATLKAYERTDYRVESERGSLVLHIGEPSVAIRVLHRAFGVASSIFVTACNPFGRRQADDANAAAMRRLQDWLDARGIRSLPGTGDSADAHWAAEPSVLALGLSVAEAPGLCREFRQNAVVAIGDDATPRLVFHPDAVLPSA